MKISNYILISLIAVAIAGCKKEYTSQSDETSQPKERLVRAVTIEPMKNPLPVVATGKVSSKKEIMLSFKTGGIIKRLLVEEAAPIKKGQLLAQLDLLEINSQVISAKNAYEKSQRDLERATNLYRDTVGTLEQKQNAKTAHDIAKANLNIANFNLQYSQIKSPIKGTVFNRLVEVGELVSPGQPIYRVGSSGSKGSQILRLGIADKDVNQLQLGDTAVVRFDAFLSATKLDTKPASSFKAGRPKYRATVTEIGQSANPRTGLFEVEITLNKFYPEVKNGFIGHIQIFQSNQTKTFKIPMNALVEGSDKEAVIFYSSNGKTVEKAVVAIDAFSEDFFTVSGINLPENAQIITEGAPFLQTNDTIKILR